VDWWVSGVNIEGSDAKNKTTASHMVPAKSILLCGAGRVCPIGLSIDVLFELLIALSANKEEKLQVYRLIRGGRQRKMTGMNCGISLPWVSVWPPFAISYYQYVFKYSSA